jgi:hypothetical protein
MNSKGWLLKNEDGTVLIIALMMLVMLTVIGISASNISNIEIQIAGNDKFYKRAFYAADGGSEIGAELIEKTLETRSLTTAGTVTVSNPNFWIQDPQIAPLSSADDVTVSNVASGQVGLKMYGNSALSSGGAIQLIAGYEGKGKGAGGSGAYMVYDIESRSTTPPNAHAKVHTKWRHMI